VQVTKRRAAAAFATTTAAFAAVLTFAPASHADEVLPTSPTLRTVHSPLRGPLTPDLTPPVGGPLVKVRDIGPGQLLTTYGHDIILTTPRGIGIHSPDYSQTFHKESFRSGFRLRVPKSNLCVTNDFDRVRVDDCRAPDGDNSGAQVFAQEAVPTKEGRIAYRIRNDQNYLKAFWRHNGSDLRFAKIPAGDSSAFTFDPF
jgi:hypothetical protein